MDQANITPGTEAFASYLQRQYALLKPELAALRHEAWRRAAGSAEIDDLAQADFRGAVTQDVAAYNAAASAHNAALKAARQTKRNVRTAAKTQAATCGSCFTVHAGDCY